MRVAASPSGALQASNDVHERGEDSRTWGSDGQIHVGDDIQVGGLSCGRPPWRSWGEEERTPGCELAKLAQRTFGYLWISAWTDSSKAGPRARYAANAVARARQRQAEAEAIAEERSRNTDDSTARVHSISATQVTAPVRVSLASDGAAGRTDPLCALSLR